MKKVIFSLFLWICAVALSAQVIVQNNGYTMIGNNATGTILSKLAVGTLGSNDAIAYIGGSHYYGLKVSNGGMDDKTGIFSTTSACSGSSSRAIGVWGQGAYNSGYGCAGIGIGVRGLSGSTNATLSRAYGVSGLIVGSRGASIYGAFGSTETAIPTGLYAGYFDGNVVVTGTINGTTIGTSDSRLKTNVLNLDCQQTLDKLLQLRPVEYNMQQVLFDADSTDENGNTVTYRVQRYNENSQIFQKKHYGLIAQEVQDIFPDLVYEGSDGYLGIDYTSLVPLLLKVVQQQQQQQQQSIEQLQLALTPQQSNAPATLYQNAPNPFNQTTSISYWLPETVSNASLYIYDLQGKQLKQTALSQYGEGTYTISGSEFPAGVYLYALIADGKEIDMKRMILTE
ncbi:MAG: tail fiber domain-containing protein [Prevotellaceae bacterium]|jgi:hypothetical protein|nr:tail fiber domain-containing protein [Prevotellaceae bacterium]